MAATLVGLNVDVMAEEMETALKSLWPSIMGSAFPEEQGGDGALQRKLLFKAIATGVIKHLKDRAGGAFEVAVLVTHTDATTNAGSGTVKIITEPGP